jgi:small nuclear ribonucleoprotein (snRNP)-like protein
VDLETYPIYKLKERYVKTKAVIRTTQRSRKVIGILRGYERAQYMEKRLFVQLNGNRKVIGILVDKPVEETL